MKITTIKSVHKLRKQKKKYILIFKYLQINPKPPGSMILSQTRPLFSLK